MGFFSCRIGEGQKKTGYKSKTLNPVFNEIFSFQLEQSRIADTNLRVAIWDHDFFGEDDFNGEGVVDLSRINLNTGTHTDWFILQLEVGTYMYMIVQCIFNNLTNIIKPWSDLASQHNFKYCGDFHFF